MLITELITGDDNKSHFCDKQVEHPFAHPLGHYSETFSASGIKFREFPHVAAYDWHNAPQAQYIIYLAGEVEVQASGGESRVFHAGDILLAKDVTGAGHITRIIKPGKAIIILA